MIVWVLRLRIFIEILHVRVGRRVIQIEVIFLDVFAVIALGSGQTEQPFLQERISAVPERHSKTEKLMSIRDARDAVLVPTIGTRTSVIMREVAPRVAATAVILAYSSPRTLRKEGTPAIPVSFFPPGSVEDGRLRWCRRCSPLHANAAESFNHP